MGNNMLKEFKNSSCISFWSSPEMKTRCIIVHVLWLSTNILDREKKRKKRKTDFVNAYYTGLVPSPRREDVSMYEYVRPWSGSEIRDWVVINLEMRRWAGR